MMEQYAITITDSMRPGDQGALLGVLQQASAHLVGIRDMDYRALVERLLEGTENLPEHVADLALSDETRAELKEKLQVLDAHEKLHAQACAKAVQHSIGQWLEERPPGEASFAIYPPGEDRGETPSAS